MLLVAATVASKRRGLAARRTQRRDLGAIREGRLAVGLLAVAQGTAGLVAGRGCARVSLGGNLGGGTRLAGQGFDSCQLGGLGGLAFVEVVFLLLFLLLFLSGSGTGAAVESNPLIVILRLSRAKGKAGGRGVDRTAVVGLLELHFFGSGAIKASTGGQGDDFAIFLLDHDSGTVADALSLLILL